MILIKTNIPKNCDNAAAVKENSILFLPEKRIVLISDEINNNTMADVEITLLQWITQDDESEVQLKDYQRQPISIYINSCGGAIDDMWRIISLIEASKTEINTYCTGYAYSAAFILFLAGDNRYLYPRASLMYHQVSSGRCGTYQDLSESVAEIEKTQLAIEQYVIENTDITHEMLEECRNNKKDWYIDAKTALGLGCCEGVITFSSIVGIEESAEK